MTIEAPTHTGLPEEFVQKNAKYVKLLRGFRLLDNDLTCTSAKDMNYPVLAERVRYFKEDVKGVATMCREVEKLAMEERQQGRAEGRAEARIESTLSAIHAMMLEFSVSAEDAMRILKVADAEKETYRKLLNQ